MSDKEIEEITSFWNQPAKNIRQDLGDSTDIIHQARDDVLKIQQLIDSQAKQLELAVKALQEIDEIYMQYIENEIECDTAATRMDNTAESALSSINSLRGSDTP